MMQKSLKPSFWISKCSKSLASSSMSIGKYCRIETFKTFFNKWFYLFSEKWKGIFVRSNYPIKFQLLLLFEVLWSTIPLARDFKN